MLEFATPLAWLLLPLPILIRWLIPATAVTPGRALVLPFLDDFRLNDSSSSQITLSMWRHSMVYLLWCLLVCALAGPQWLGKPIPLVKHGRPILLGIDISGSMQIADMVVKNHHYDRITLVKAVAERFIKRRQGDQIGLLLFGSRAYLQTPLTYDHQTVIAQLKDATIGLAGQHTAMGDAIGLAIKRLSNVPKNNRVLVLLTDGATNAGVDPLTAAKLAAKHHVRIYTIGLGADEIAVQTPFGTQYQKQSSDLDPDTLKKVADITGGAFFRANDAAALVKAYQQLDKLEPIVTNNTATYRPLTPLYPWPLGLALGLSLGLLARQIDYRRRTVASRKILHAD